MAAGAPPDRDMDHPVVRRRNADRHRRTRDVRAGLDGADLRSQQAPPALSLVNRGDAEAGEPVNRSYIGAADSLYHHRHDQDASFHGNSETWITSSSSSPPTALIARSVSPRPNVWVVSKSSGYRCAASCSSASSQAR